MAVLVLFSISCSGEAELDQNARPLVAFDTGSVAIISTADTVPLLVELAQTDEQRSYGLMERASLEHGSGMLFLYDEAQDSTSGFWMFRTLIPLDIAFLDENGTIVKIEQMSPCGSPNPQLCPTYSTDKSYVAALEVNQGFFAQHGIREGDRVIRIES